MAFVGKAERAVGVASVFTHYVYDGVLGSRVTRSPGVQHTQQLPSGPEPLGAPQMA